MVRWKHNTQIHIPSITAGSPKNNELEVLKENHLQTLDTVNKRWSKVTKLAMDDLCARRTQVILFFLL